MQKTVKVAEVKVNYNPRKDFSKVKDIAKSIGEVGLLNPIVLREDKDGTLWLVDGEQRLRAMKDLDQKEVAANIITLSDQQAVEATMIANLMRSDLTFIEKARGFEHLLNDKLKYTEKVISTKFGVPEKDVKFMIKVARSLDPKCDKIIHEAEELDMDDLKVLVQIPKARQVEIAEKAVKQNMNAALAAMAYPLLSVTGEVFKVEHLVSSGKAFLVDYGYHKRYYTFEKLVHDEAKAEYEAAQKAKGKKADYAGEERESGTKAKAVSEKQREENRKERERDKKKYADACAALAMAVPKFLARKPSGETIKELSENYLRALSVDECKTLLRAFKVEFKATELSTEQIRGLVWDRILKSRVTTAEQVVQLWALGEMNNWDSGPSGPKFNAAKWVKGLDA